MPAARSWPAVGAVSGIVYVAGGNDGAHETATLQAFDAAANTWRTLAPMPAGRYAGSGAAEISGKLYVPGGWDNSYSWLPHNELFIYNPASNTWSAGANMPNRSGNGFCATIGGKLYVVTHGDGFSGYRQYLHVYDPGSNNWARLADEPRVHEGAAAGVINGKLYVAGGNNGIVMASAELDVYDPRSNAWSSLAPMPAARSFMGSAVLDGRLYAIGGQDAAGNYLNTVIMYDPVSNTWSTGPSLAAVRRLPGAAVANGVLYAVGGSVTNVLLTSLEAYVRPIRGEWTGRTPAPAGRSGAAVGSVNGVVYVAGGFDGSHETATLQAFDTASNTWRTLAPMPGGRYGGDGAAEINGRLYVPGGWDNSYTWLPHSELFIYNPANDTWSSGANMPNLSACGFCGAIGGKLYVVTHCNGYSGYRQFLHVYDPASNTWTRLADEPRVHDGAAVGAINGKLYVAGGNNGIVMASADLDVYDPRSNAWSPLAPMPSARGFMGSAVLDGRLYAIGGQDAAGNRLTTVEVYDPANNTWSTAPSLNVARNNLGAAEARGAIYALGGSRPGNPTAADVEAYVRPLLGDWTGRASLPGGRLSPAVGAVNGVVYVAGGKDNAHETATLYAYNAAANTWSARAPMPSGRYEGDGAAEINGKLYVPGGWDNSYSWLPHNDLFVYDPANNTWSSGANMPNRSGSGFCGAIGGKLYVVTHTDGYGGYRQFLHVYDPASNAWTRLADEPRVHVGAAVGVINGKLYVAGGHNGIVAASVELDVYDPVGNTWSPRAPMPAARAFMGGAVLGGRLYAMGGADAAGNLVTTVEVYDPASDTWSAGPSLEVARHYLAAAAANGTIHAVGGYRSDAPAAADVEAYPAPPAPAVTTATLGNWVWHDSNFNGIQDGSETGMPGFVVRLRLGGTTQVAVTVTDASGFYLFNGVPPGSYRIEVMNPDPYHFWFALAHAGTNPAADSDVDNSGLSGTLTLGAGESNLDVDAGLQTYVPRLSVTKLARPLGGTNALHGQILHVAPGTQVVYTYVVTNTGNTWFVPLLVEDDQLGHIGGMYPPELFAPGDVVVYAATTTVFTATTNFTEACGTPTDLLGRPLDLQCDCPFDLAIVELGSTPVIICPPDQVAPCGGDLSTNALGAPIVVSSTCPCVVTYTDIPVSNICGNALVFQRRFTVADGCGYTAFCTQQIVVTDFLAPTLSGVPAATTVQCVADAPPPPVVTATDNCDTNVPVLLVEEPIGSWPTAILRRWTATDACGNAATGTQTITVRDTTPPLLVCPPDLTLTGSANGRVALPWQPVLGVDNCDGTNVTIIQSPPAGAVLSGASTTLVTVVALDTHTNAAVCAFRVVVISIPGFEVVKTRTVPASGPVVFGEPVEFLVMVRNTGTVTLTAASVEDTYEINHLFYLNATPPTHDNGNDGMLNWADVGPLAPGASTTLTVRFESRLATMDGVTTVDRTNAVVVTAQTSSDAPAVGPQTSSAPYRIEYGAIGNTVWFDRDEDGLIDEPLVSHGISGVTVQLQRVVGGATSVVARAVTTSNAIQGGFYLFTNLPAGVYIVSNGGGLPPSIRRCTRPGIPDCYTIALTATGMTNLDVDFGYTVTPSCCMVDLVYFRGVQEGGVAWLEWMTAAEMDNLGFHLYRAEMAAGPRTRITAALIPGVGTGRGRTYAWADDTLPAEGAFYWLEDVDLDGTRTLHGPVRIGAPSHAVASGFLALAGSVCRIGVPALRTAGLDVTAVDGSLFEVRIDGTPVSAYCTAQGRPMTDSDYVLFYAGGETGSPRNVSVRLREGAPRMEAVYAGPLYEALPALGVAAEAMGLTPVTLAGTECLVAVCGLGEPDAWVLDVTDPTAPRLLLGAELMLQAPGLSLFFSPATGRPAACLVVEPRAVTDL